MVGGCSVAADCLVPCCLRASLFRLSEELFDGNSVDRTMAVVHGNMADTTIDDDSTAIRKCHDVVVNANNSRASVEGRIVHHAVYQRAYTHPHSIEPPSEGLCSRWSSTPSTVFGRWS